MTTAVAPRLLDELLPAYDVNEVHCREVAAAADEVFAAMRTITAADPRVTGPLMALRGLVGGRRPPADRGWTLLEAMRGRDFALLGERAGEELVLGLIAQPWRPVPVTRPIVDAADFEAFAEPGWVRVATNLRVDPEGAGSRLVIETRVQATDAGARGRFACYWRVIRLGSGVIRRDLLAAIARRAEASA